MGFTGEFGTVYSGGEFHVAYCFLIFVSGGVLLERMLGAAEFNHRTRRGSHTGY